MLRNLYFISSRLGRDGFSQYTFVYLTAIDILSKYPVQAEAFLREIRPAELGRIPQHPLDRCHDLFFLNTAEHFTLVLTPNMNEELLIGAATPYLGIGGDQRLREIFEAAHTVMLAVLAAPQCADMTVKYMPFYVDALFKVSFLDGLLHTPYFVLSVLFIRYFHKTSRHNNSEWLLKHLFELLPHPPLSQQTNHCCPLLCLSLCVLVLRAHQKNLYRNLQMRHLLQTKSLICLSRLC